MMHNKDILVISILTVITVMAWIIFDVYHTSVTSTITEVQQALVTPLNPKLDTNTINKLRQAQKL